MSLTHVKATARSGPRVREIDLLVDSGATYSVLPHADWQALGLRPERHVEFVLADGTKAVRGVSECRLELLGVAGTSPVVLGEEGDAGLLGTVTLEVLGLMLNPITRELLPMRLFLV